jgi:hypothetical protein
MAISPISSSPSPAQSALLPALNFVFFVQLHPFFSSISSISAAPSACAASIMLFLQLPSHARPWGKNPTTSGRTRSPRPPLALLLAPV